MPLSARGEFIFLIFLHSLALGSHVLVIGGGEKKKKEREREEKEDKNLEIAFRLLKGMPRSVVALGVAQGGLAQWG